MRGVVVAGLLALSACALNVPTAREIPIGGVRESFVRENLAAAREGMAGGLLEPGWLPDDFVLVNAEFIGASNRPESVDLNYQGQLTYLHIWQTHATPEELGDSDPVPMGAPLEDTDWNANPLPAAQAGRPGIVEFSTRLADGRTVAVDTDLDEDTARRVLSSMYLRGPGSASR